MPQLLASDTHTPDGGACAAAYAAPFPLIPEGPNDPILSVAEAFRADKFPQKVNLGIGAYRDDGGLPIVLGSVREAERQLHEEHTDKEYPSFAGVADFIQGALCLAYGADAAPLLESRIAAVQSISGTGALRLGASLLERFYKQSATIYLPSPSWGNHAWVFAEAGLTVAHYRYYDAQSRALDLDGMLADLGAAPEGSIVLLHACAHNPTGVDPTEQEWTLIEEAVRRRKHLPFFDMAYQGFATGDVDKDAFALRHFVARGHNIALAQSFSKNMGLYGERAGTFSWVCDTQQSAANAVSQLKLIARGIYSFAPIHGALIAARILNNADLRRRWTAEIKEMADRIMEMRAQLKARLVALGSAHNWDHITSQIGMFCYTGMQASQVERIVREFHVYMPTDGRISMAGVNSSNVEYLARSIFSCTG